MRAIAVSACVVALALGIAAPADAKPRFKVTEVNVVDNAEAGSSLQVRVGIRNSGKRRKRAQLSVVARPLAGGADVTLWNVVTNRLRGGREFEIDRPGPATAGEYSAVACVPKRGNRGALRCASDSFTVIEHPGEPNFTPGARTLNDPLLPQLGNGGYDAAHYGVNLHYDPTANVFDKATTTMSATATQDLSQLSLDFQDLPVDRVLVNGATATFSQVDGTPALAGGGTQPMKLVVNPAVGIANGSTFTVTVEYHGTPQVFTDPDGSDEGWINNAGGSSSFVVGEPMGAQAWFPSNNHPSDKASFDTTITVPTGRTAVGVGELVSQTANGDGTTTWSWHEDSPTSTYLVTASSAQTTAPGGFQQSAITESLTGRSLPIYDLVAPSALGVRAASIAPLLARNAEMIDALGAHYGPYPLDSYGSVWDINPGVGYALEVQTKSHFSSVVGAGTYLHELAHQWWGDAVTLHDWNDLWFNEGWAQFSDWLFAFESGANADSPKDHLDDEYANASPGDWSIAPAVLDNDPAKMFSPSFPTYTRGAMTLAGFREIIGAAAFDQFARDLQTEFAHGNIDTPQFIAFAKAKSGLAGAQLDLLDQFFQQWLYGTTKPTLTYADF
jgi:hypothetical protein